MGDGKWINTPYPVLTTYPALGTLVGNVTVTFTVGNSQEIKTERLENVVVPLRVNFFENRTKIAGTLSTNSEGTISLNFDPKDIGLYTDTNTNNLVGYYTNNRAEPAFSQRIYSLNDPVIITNKPQGEFDVFVLAKTEGTQVW